MNIFVLHNNPATAARMLCDKHVSKMILETAQMLSTVAVSLGYDDHCLYKPVHAKHPCTLWAGANKWNWEWLCLHGLAMADEFENIYKTRHKSSEVIEFIYDNNMAPKGKPYSLFRWMTPFAQAMPDQYKQSNAVEAYRAYYIGEKKRFAKWTNRKPPHWWPNNEENL